MVPQIKLHCGFDKDVHPPGIVFWAQLEQITYNESVAENFISNKNIIAIGNWKRTHSLCILFIVWLQSYIITKNQLTKTNGIGCPQQERFD